VRLHPARTSLIFSAAVVLLTAGFIFAASTGATTGGVDNTQVTHDSLGQRVDAHDGDLLQVADGTIYAYGTAYGCGFRLGVSSAYCGVRVYSSRDLQTWTPAGAVGGQYAFDHLTPDWQTRCSPPGAYGCYRPHVVQRPADGKFVMWLNTAGDGGYKVLIADAPGGPFVDTGIVPNLAVKPPTGGLRYGDEDLTVGPDGVGWVSYTAIWPLTNRHDIVVERLDPSLTTGTGASVSLGLDLVEAPGLFLAPTGKWEMIYSDPAKPYLVTGTSIMDAPSPLGPWTGPRTLNANSCGGQPAGVWPIKGQSGVTTWVYGTDRWDPGNPNQSMANNYYGALTFNATGGTAIDGYGCQPSWSLR